MLLASGFQPSDTAYSSLLCPCNSNCLNQSGACPLPLHVSPSGERYLTLTAGLLFRVRREGMTSLRLSPNALNFPFISSKTAAFASTSLFCLNFSARSRTARSSCGLRLLHISSMRRIRSSDDRVSKESEDNNFAPKFLPAKAAQCRIEKNKCPHEEVI
jgi:hypothetical protein